MNGLVRPFPRPDFNAMKPLACLALFLFVLCPALNAADKPNILFIAIDDQNDWIGHLGGHPMAKTPNIDKLAARGTTFLNAHCNMPLCNPSRTSLLLGLRPTTTGIYGLSPWFRTLPQWKDRVALPQHFENNGYLTAATGKIYHGGTGGGGGGSKGKNAAKKTPAAQPEFMRTAPLGGVGTKPPQKLTPPAPMGNHPAMDWGVWPKDNDDTGKGDYQVASWTVEQIKTAPKDQPFFIAAGFFLPHVPCYATQKWFDLYPDDDSVLPKILENDRQDTPRFSWYIHWELPEPRLKWIKENNQWRNLVRSYLACTSFVDSQIGRLMTALDEAGVAERRFRATADAAAVAVLRPPGDRRRGGGGIHPLSGRYSGRYSPDSALGRAPDDGVPAAGALLDLSAGRRGRPAPVPQARAGSRHRPRPLGLPCGPHRRRRNARRLRAPRAARGNRSAA